MADLCLSLICPPQVQEKLLDSLLMLPDVEVFTTASTFSHGTAQGRLTAAEQVLGRSRSMTVTVLITHAAFERIRDFLAGDFAGTGIRYWASPVTFEGEFR